MMINMPPKHVSMQRPHAVHFCLDLQNMTDDSPFKLVTVEEPGLIQGYMYIHSQTCGPRSRSFVPWYTAWLCGTARTYMQRPQSCFLGLQKGLVILLEVGDSGTTTQTHWLDNVSAPCVDVKSFLSSDCWHMTAVLGWVLWDQELTNCGTSRWSVLMNNESSEIMLNPLELHPFWNQGGGCWLHQENIFHSELSAFVSFQEVIFGKGTSGSQSVCPLAKANRQIILLSSPRGHRYLPNQLVGQPSVLD